MASSFQIYYPDVPRNALVTTTATAYDPDYPVASTVTGLRQNYGQLAAATTATQITYDLGTGNSRTVDHFLLGGVKALRSSPVVAEARLEGSNNGTTWVSQLGTATAFATRAFYGPNGHDLLFTPSINDTFAATLAAYRYFRVTLSASGSLSKFAVSKLYFGAGLDLGKEPDNYDLTVDADGGDAWPYPRGQSVLVKAMHARHTVTVEWDGVTDAKALEFTEKVVRHAGRHSLFLSTSTYLDPLYDNRLMHVELVAGQTSVTRQKGAGDWNDVKEIFRELI